MKGYRYRVYCRVTRVIETIILFIQISFRYGSTGVIPSRVGRFLGCNFIRAIIKRGAKHKILIDSLVTLPEG